MKTSMCLLLALAAAACGGDRTSRGEATAGIGDAGPGSDGGLGTDAGTAGGQGSDSEGGGIFDVGDSIETDGMIDPCPGLGGSGAIEFSYIWIANSPEGTLSKIDTMTLTEVARYRTGPGAPDPSRTSVSLTGDVVALNRAGSATKIAARSSDCADGNGDGIITTSDGPMNILPWGADECVLWHTPLDFLGGGGGPRSVAWDVGDVDEQCGGLLADVWVGFLNPGYRGQVRRLDGATGAVEASLEIPNWVQIHDQGLYGGASDADGNFWVIGKGGALVRVDAQTLAVQRWDQPTPPNNSETFYGMALDSHGEPWMSGQSGHLYHFDPATEQFEVWDLQSHLIGMAIDRDGFAWIGRSGPGSCGVAKFDTNAKAHVSDIALPGCFAPVGISVDVEGFVWVVDMGSNQAFKLDPAQETSQTVAGLVSPYTYSDMTGAGLALVVDPPAG